MRFAESVPGAKRLRLRVRRFFLAALVTAATIVGTASASWAGPIEGC